MERFCAAVFLRTIMKELRKQANLTQQELGKLVGVTKVSICCYENGTRSPELANLIELAESLEVDFVWLLGMEEKIKYGDDKITNMSANDVKLIKYLKKNNKELYNSLIEEITTKNK